MKDWYSIVKTPFLTTDSVIIKNGRILLEKRKSGLFGGYWALPGGFVKMSETLKEAIKREVLEETGLKVVPEKTIGIYDDPKRDPEHGHAVTVAFMCRITGGKVRLQPEEVADLRFFPLSETRKLKIAFDHRKIISDALKMQRRKP